MACEDQLVVGKSNVEREKKIVITRWGEEVEIANLAHARPFFVSDQEALEQHLPASMAAKIRAHLILSDGTKFPGWGFGCTTRAAVGEAVFQTGMVGYAESLTGMRLPSTRLESP